MSQEEAKEVICCGRRQFLRGSGGLLLAIPFLPSLLPRVAEAQSAARPKFYVAMTTGHGAVWYDHMFPADSVLTETATYAGRTIRRGDLEPTDTGSEARLSEVLRASPSLLTPSLARKLNVITGFDIPWYIAHHSGGHLGNFAANDAHEGEPIPTIDQVMANSPEFYSSVSGVLERSLHLGSSGYPTSFNWSNPAAESGAIQAITASTDSLQAFNSVFVQSDAAPAPQAARTPVVDRVYENFRRLLTGNRRISSSDRRRLDEHIARLDEIQRRATVVVECSGLDRPTRNARDLYQGPGPQGTVDSIAAFQLFNDVIVAAFMCGTSRIAVVGAHHQDFALFSDYVGDWHLLAHAASQAGNAAPVEAQEAEGWFQDANRNFFASAFLDLVNKLDVDNGTGGRLLDDALVVWTQEHGHVTHNGFSIPIVTAGSAGGALRTGSYVDYRNRDVDQSVGGGLRFSPGLLWNQWLGVQLQAMGLARTSYESARYQPERPSSAGTAGYGPFHYQGNDIQNENAYGPAERTLGEIPLYLRPA